MALQDVTAQSECITNQVLSWVRVSKAIYWLDRPLPNRAEELASLTDVVLAELIPLKETFQSPFLEKKECC